MNVFWMLVGVLVLGLMVLVHEWGHFIVARLFGIRVQTFSIGFGPRLLGWKRGQTDYRLSAIPLGGYVSLAGENPLLERTGAPDEFLSRPRWQRAVVYLAGPTVNIVMAVLLLWILFSFSYQRAAYVDEPAQIHSVLPDSAAAQAGILPGDVIVQLGKKRNPIWEDVQVEIALGGEEPLTVRISREGEEFELVVKPELGEGQDMPVVGWMPYLPLVITEVEPGMPADAAGLKAGDEIAALEEKSTTQLGASGFVERIQSSQGAPLRLTVRRAGEEFEIEVSAQEREWRGRTAYFLGIQIGPRVTSVELNLLDALKTSVAENARMAGLLYELIRRLFAGRASLQAVQGPIGIVNLSGQAAQLGWGPLMHLMAIISVNLGILNLLPIPILDGGHIAMLGIEGIRRRDLSLRVKERFLQLGFMLLMLLFVVVMYNDVMRYFFR
ncbi:MAG: RIP metalloprotease RseP [Acidobacteria bacterium]|nr:RIP metalloprotease RseP [Acidobacteriota bacterium]